MTEERQRAGGRRQKEENAIFSLCQKGRKPLNLFMGILFCPLPSYFCLLNIPTPYRVGRKPTKAAKFVIMAKKPVLHPYADYLSFQRLLLLIATLVQHPGVGCCDTNASSDTGMLH